MPRSKSPSKSQTSKSSNANSSSTKTSSTKSSGAKSKKPPVQIDELFQTVNRYEEQRLNQWMHDVWRAASTTYRHPPLRLTPQERKPEEKRRRMLSRQEAAEGTTEETTPEAAQEATPKAAEDFGHTHFAAAQLGDVRRTRRLVHSANVIMAHPGGTLPERFQNPNDLRAFYDLCQVDQVTHQTLLAPHVLHTLEQIAHSPQTVLVLHDQTELNFTSHRSLQHLGQIGDGGGRGYLAHNSLAVDLSPGSQGAALGLVGQILHCRPEVPKDETAAQKRERESRESLLWLRGVEGLPGDGRIVDVCDRGADCFEFLSHEWYSGRRFVVRVRQTNRSIQPGHGAGDSAGKVQGLDVYLENLPAWNPTPWTIEVQATKNQPARKAQVSVAAAAVTLQVPQSKKGNYVEQPLPVWAVRIWEEHPPAGVEPLHWLLYTNEPVHNLVDVRRIQHWYELRWIVEEYHKAQKTGCCIENLQFTREWRLQPVIALLSVVAWKLLNLRDLARRGDAKEVAAGQVICEDYVEVLSRWRHGIAKSDWTVHDFYYALARLGGHQNRRRDSFPGWIVLWRGWMKLQTMMNAAGPLLEENRKLQDKINNLEPIPTEN